MIKSVHAKKDVTENIHFDFQLIVLFLKQLYNFVVMNITSSFFCGVGGGGGGVLIGLLNEAIRDQMTDFTMLSEHELGDLGMPRN